MRAGLGWMGSTGGWLERGNAQWSCTASCLQGFCKPEMVPLFQERHPAQAAFAPPLVMMDRDEFIAGLKLGGCLGTDDHDQITFTLGKERTFLNSNLYPPCFERANFPKQGEIMSEISSEETFR